MKHDWPLQGDSKCPFCEPIAESNAHNFRVGKLEISTMCLSRNQAYPGTSLVIFDQHAERLSEVDTRRAAVFFRDLTIAARAVEAVFKPDHMNYVLLGNSVRHLHWHIIPRYESDPRWGAPIWTTCWKDF